MNDPVSRQQLRAFALSLAIENKHECVVELLSPFSRIEYAKALLVAAVYGHATSANTIVNLYGEHPTHQSLVMATLRGHRKVVSALLGKGLHIEGAGDALAIAVACKDAAIVKILLARGGVRPTSRHLCLAEEVNDPAITHLLRA